MRKGQGPFDIGTSLVGEGSTKVFISLALLVVLLFAVVGFAVHFLWFLAVISLSSGSSGSGWDAGRAQAGIISTGGELLMSLVVCLLARAIRPHVDGAGRTGGPRHRR